MNRTQLLQLSADLDQVIELRSDDDESHYLRNTGAVGALGVGGAYLRGKRIPVNAPGGLLTVAEAQPGFMGAARRAGGTIAQGGRALAGDLGLTGIKDTFMKGYSREGGGIMRGIRGVARKLTKGRSAMVGLSAKTENLLTLSAELDDVVEFGIMDKVRSFIPKLKDLKSGYSANRLAGTGRLDSISQSAVAGAKKLNAGGYGYMPKKQIEIPGSLSQFSAELDQVINFDLAGNIGKALWRGTTGRAALKWGGIGAAGGALAGGVSGALSDDPNKSAIGGALNGAVAGGALGAIGGGGMRAYKSYGAMTAGRAANGGRILAKAVPAAAAPATATATATAAADQMAARAASAPSQVAGQTTHGSAAYPNTSVADALAAKNAARVPTAAVPGQRSSFEDAYGIKPRTSGAPAASGSTNPHKQNVQYDSSAAAPTGLPAGVMPQSADSLGRTSYGPGNPLHDRIQKRLGTSMQYSSRLQSLVQLSAELEGVVEFGVKGFFKEMKAGWDAKKKLGAAGMARDYVRSMPLLATGQAATLGLGLGVGASRLRKGKKETT